MIQGFLALFELWSLGFWLLAVISSILLIVAVEKDKHFLSTIVVALLGWIFWKNFQQFTLKQIGITAGIYLAVGAVYSVYRWFRFANDSVNDVNSGRRYKGSLESDLNPAHNKSRITGWIAYWPWSLFWNLLGDVFHLVFDTIYEQCSRIYKSISDSALSKLKK